MAREYGIYGFCYYHYWFNGHLLLERPLEDMLNSKEPDFPFMICWANENWTRAWDGGEKEILIEQKYSEEDDINHIRYLMKFFKDKRYIKVNNKPVVSIYRSTLLPNIEKTIEIWRREALKEDIELYICRFESHGTDGPEYMAKSIDAAIDFAPFTGMKEYYQYNKYANFKRRVNKLLHLLIRKNIYTVIEDYKKYVLFQLKRTFPLYKRYPCIFPMWDNSARRKKSWFFAFINSTPEYFGMWLKYLINIFIPFTVDENFIFVNAWNEWAEGNHLEPDMKWGKRYLEEIRRLLVEL